MPYYSHHSISQFSGHSQLQKLIGTNKIVLDVGCNKGYIGENSDKSNTFYGLEYDTEALKIAQKNYTQAYFYNLNNLKELDFDVKKFDTIIFADVLEHVLFPEQSLKYFDKYLNDNGIVIVSLPNIANWMVRLKLLIGKFDYTEGGGIMDKTHLHLYTYKSAIKLVEDAGFVVTKQSFGSSIFGPIISVFPFLKGLFATNIILVCKK
jgi:2-polyprenyl-3-methyl-5-hydroxy-6-metoxy-1,4-benzoquinol methylase